MTWITWTHDQNPEDERPRGQCVLNGPHDQKCSGADKLSLQVRYVI